MFNQLITHTMKKKVFMAMMAMAIGVACNANEPTTHNSITGEPKHQIVEICINGWAGQVWVEEYTYGEGSRTVTDWHLMATNTTGVGHCLEGIIIVNGREIPVCEFVPASANSKKNAVSIYHLNQKFSVKKNSFHSVEGWKCR